MIKERNERINEDVEKNAKKRAKKDTLEKGYKWTVILIILSIYINLILEVSFWLLCIPSVMWLWGGYIYAYFKLKESYIIHYTNVRKTEEKLVKGCYVEVVPKKKSEFISDLSIRAKFFATLVENKVHILVKYNGENDYIPYKTTKKGCFWDKYELVEENEN